MQLENKWVKGKREDDKATQLNSNSRDDEVMIWEDWAKAARLNGW